MTNHDNRILKAVSYSRYSTDMQRNESIEAQQRAVAKYATQHGYLMIGSYIDIAKSAKNDNRPDFQRMISDSESGLFDIIIVHKLDRFARNRFNSVIYRQKLKENGVRLLSVVENYDADTPEGALIESMYDGMNEFYIRNLGREVKKGQMENAYQAMFNGGTPPLGYDVDEGLKYVINDHEAEIVKTIFDMTSDGIGYGRIIDHLNSFDYRTKSGGKFVKNSLHEILKNEKYIGIYEFNKRPTRDVYGKRNNRGIKTNEEIVRLEGAIPSIVDKETFYRIRKKMEKRKQNRGSNTAKEVYLLSGKMICGKCGMTYVGIRKFNSQKRKYVYYGCNCKQRKGDCDAKPIAQNQIESYVINELAKYIFDKTIIKKLVKAYGEYLTKINSGAYTQIDALHKRLKDIDKQINNIVNVISKTGSDALVQKLNELETQKQEITFKMANESKHQSELNITESELKKSFDIAKELFLKKSLSTTKKLIDMYVDKIIIDDESIELKLMIKPDFPLPSIGNDTIKIKENKKLTHNRVSFNGAHST